MSLIRKEDIPEARRHLAAQNALYEKHQFVEMPRHLWAMMRPQNLRRILRSRDWLVQVFDETGGIVRLSVNRTALADDGRWLDGITWDELQEVKRMAGYGDRLAVEIYPSDERVVNVGNMRHLWLLPEPLPYAW